MVGLTYGHCGMAPQPKTRKLTPKASDPFEWRLENVHMRSVYYTQGFFVLLFLLISK